MTTTQCTPAQSIISAVNALAGSSASGMYVIVDTATGAVSSELFTEGSRPPLAATEKLVKIGRRIAAHHLADDDWDASQ